ncbi:unnamed protein product [Phytophthora fragariaefolia]|uniref:Unnamed protein product n=1 Tax=Phytophthora fragariaefolia TaxID=1490495 RepID=A0A9W6UCZ5_9STRA|nr:unnamed protein product [Phytophthora fragariaefolia]
MVIACEHCHVAAVRVSERDINGYTGVCVPEELKTLRTNLICADVFAYCWWAQHSVESCRRLQFSLKVYALLRLWWWRALYSVTISERPTSVRPAAPTYLGSAKIISNEYENDPDLGSGFDDQQFAGRSSELPPVCLAVGVEAAGRRRGSGPPDSVYRLEDVERLQTAAFAALRQDLPLLKAQIVQVSQAASNVQVDLGSRLAVLRTRVGALEQASAPSHQDYETRVARKASAAQHRILLGGGACWTVWPKEALPAGFEPATLRLTAARSTN